MIEDVDFRLPVGHGLFGDDPAVIFKFGRASDADADILGLQLRAREPLTAEDLARELGIPEDFAGPLGYMAARCAPLAAAGPDAVIAAAADAVSDSLEADVQDADVADVDRADVDRLLVGRAVEVVR